MRPFYVWLITNHSQFQVSCISRKAIYEQSHILYLYSPLPSSIGSCPGKISVADVFGGVLQEYSRLPSSNLHLLSIRPYAVSKPPPAWLKPEPLTILGYNVKCLYPGAKKSRSDRTSKFLRLSHKMFKCLILIFIAKHPIRQRKCIGTLGINDLAFYVFRFPGG